MKKDIFKGLTDKLKNLFNKNEDSEMYDKNVYDHIDYIKKYKNYYTKEEIKQQLELYRKKKKLSTFQKTIIKQKYTQENKSLIEKVIDQYSISEIVEKIGVDKVETYLRTKKLEKLQKNIKK